MNYEQADSVKELAPGINKVLERLDVECPVCGGIGYIKHNNDEIRSHCRSCQTKGKVKWKWQPKVGEWCFNNKFLKGSPLLITKGNCPDPKHYTPILEWEEIERVLEKAGYYFTRGWEGIECEGVLYIQKEGDYKEKVQIEIDFRDCSRLIAVYKAVLALGKEKK